MYETRKDVVVWYDIYETEDNENDRKMINQMSE